MTDGPQHPRDLLLALRDADKQAQRPSPTTPKVPLPDDRTARYAQQAMRRELEALGASTEGTRNDQLNTSAFNLGQLVGAGVLDEREVRDTLESVALSVGLEHGETLRSISSGVSAGILKPRLLMVAPDPGPHAQHQPAKVPEAESPAQAETDEFWHSRDLLRHVHDTAKARRCSPWAVLGVVLCRVVTQAPVAVVLPPIVGGAASLNLFVGLVGPSGSGKGAAERVAAACLSVGHIETATTGSGEGIGHSYRYRKQGQLEWHNDSHAVLFSVPEIDTLSALGSRKGATLLPELRRAWSGEALGFAYADPSRRLDIPAHEYRLCLVAGIQPTRAGALLDDADGGTPQRFLWLPATDPEAPDKAPPCPARRTWQPPKWTPPDQLDGLTGQTHVAVCELARSTIDTAHLARARGLEDALDGHLLLSQLKAAAALAMLDGRLGVTDEDWRLADVLVRQSTATRTVVVKALRHAASAKNVAQAEAEAQRAEVVSERQEEAQHKRVCRNVLRGLAGGEWVARSPLRNGIAGRDRKAFDPAVEALIQTGQIERHGDGTATRYRRC